MSRRISGGRIDGARPILNKSRSLKGVGDPHYLEILLDTKTNDVWAEELEDPLYKKHVQITDESIISIGNLYEPITPTVLKLLILSVRDNYETVEKLRKQALDFGKNIAISIMWDHVKQDCVLCHANFKSPKATTINIYGYENV